MENPISLKDAERKAYVTMFNDGLTDIFLGCVILLFSIAPLLSKSMGDFWSSAIFLPFWLLMYIVIKILRNFFVVPRIGTMKIGPARKKKIRKYWIVLLFLNIIILTIGIGVAKNYNNISSHLPAIVAGLFVIAVFSVGAYQLDIKRLYLYGFIMGISPVCGEYLFGKGYASHHGFPVVFGVVSAIMIIVGLVLFINLLIKNPKPLIFDEEAEQNG